VPVVAGPEVERTFASAHATLALTVFLVPGVIALVIEPLLFLLADRHPRRWFVHGGLAAMAVGVWLAALAPGPIVLALALSVVWPASGLATGIAEATLVDRTPDQRGRTLARWTLWGLAGDLLAPGLLAALAVFGASWRAAFAIVGGMLAVWLIALAATHDRNEPARAEAEEPGMPLLAALREALRDRVLLAWLFGTRLCDLLDEILVVFAAIHLRVDLGAGPIWQSAAAAAFVVGGAAGLVATDRILRVRGERWLLAACGIACAVCYVAWLAAPTPLFATLLFTLVGACAAPLYPLASAQAYARRPDASGSVLAAGRLFEPLGLALPLLVGIVADHAGTGVALALLAAQPIGLVVLVAATRR
jgi:MFS family permease